nr:hypothetical protein [Micromonospora sp. DSM 115978]
MSRQQLGRRWVRRIARLTGAEIVQATGNGTYWHAFTTADHRHGRIHAVDHTVLWSTRGGHMASCFWLFGDESDAWT